MEIQAFTLPDLKIPPELTKKKRKKKKNQNNIKIIHSSKQRKNKSEDYEGKKKREARVPTTPVRNEPGRNTILQPHIGGGLRRGDGWEIDVSRQQQAPVDQEPGPA